MRMKESPKSSHEPSTNPSTPPCAKDSGNFLEFTPPINIDDDDIEKVLNFNKSLTCPESSQKLNSQWHPDMISIFEDPHKDSSEVELKPVTVNCTQYYEIGKSIECIYVISKAIREFEYESTIGHHIGTSGGNKTMKIEIVVLDTEEDESGIAPTFTLNQAFKKVGGFGWF
jgi:hypothetical protein